jgi:hypothetical protein
MAAITGKDGAVSIGGGAITGKVLEWVFQQTSRNVETGGAGDTHQERIHLRLDWEATARCEAPDQANWDLREGLTGTAAVFSFKRKASDANPYVTGTGLVTSHSVNAPFDNRIEYEVQIVCNGTAVTFDNTPAS